MLRKITHTLLGLPNKQAVYSCISTRIFSSAAVVDHGEYIVRTAVDTDCMRIVELRGRELWHKFGPLTPLDAKLEEKHLISVSQTPSFYCIVAVKNENKKEEEGVKHPDMLYGALDLMVAINAEKGLRLGNVPPEVKKSMKGENIVIGIKRRTGRDTEKVVQKRNIKVKENEGGGSGGPDPNTSEDAHITDLAVDPLVRRRLVATNLLSFAKNVAISRGMKRIYLEVGLGNKAAVDMYLKAGYEKLSEDDEDEDHGIRMGLRL